MRELQMKFIGKPTNVRWFRLLNIIERDQNFKIKDLARQVEVSQRTIIKDVNSFKDYFSDSVLFLPSKGNGYTFEEIDRIKYKEQKQELLRNELLFEIVGNVFYGEQVTIEEIADYYTTSESTVRRLLLQIIPVLKAYDLKLSLTPIDFVGEEGSLRKFFKDFYYEGEETPHTILPPKDLHELVLNKIVEQLGNYEVGSGTTPAAFYYTLFIAIERYRQGHSITIPNDLKEIIFNDKDFLLLYSLRNEIEKEFGVLLATDEFAWVYVICICKRTINRIDQEDLFFKKYNFWPALTLITREFLSEHQLDDWNQPGLKIFLQAFFLSKKINDLICPTLNKVQKEVIDAVKENNPIVYDRNLNFLKHCNTSISFSFSYIEDLCVSLTMYSDIIIEYYSVPKKILFLLEGDHLMCQNTRMLAQRILGNKNSIVFLPLQKLTDSFLNEEKVDLVVTNYRPYLVDYQVNTECILINTVPNSKDWERIIEKVNPYFKRILFK